MPPRSAPLAAGVPLQRKTALGNANAASARHRESAARMAAPKRARNTGPNRSTLKILAARSEGLCEFWQCLDPAGHTHHRRPRRMGGSSAPDTNLPANLVRLCPGHHDFVESQRAKALEIGLLLHAGAAPAKVPVLLRHGRVLLGNDGTWSAS